MLVKQIKPDEWFLALPVPNIDNKMPVGNSDIQLLVDKLIAYNSRNKTHYYISQAIPFCSYNPEKIRQVAFGAESCGPRSILVIDPFGNIKPCYSISEKLGNIFEDSIEDCWNKNFAKDMRKNKTLPRECKECHYISECLGGCRFSAWLSTGRYDGKDPLMNEKFLQKNDSYWQAKIENVVEAGGAMVAAEYDAILQEIIRKASCNLLVFGLGQDSKLWREANENGLTVFIEDKVKWMQDLPDAPAYKVKYQTLLDKKWEDNPIIDFPEWLKDYNWEIVIVDAPHGYKQDMPGRLSTIKKAAELCKKGTIFVHDMNRENEKDFTAKFLGKQFMAIERLGVWTRG